MPFACSLNRIISVCGENIDGRMSHPADVTGYPVHEGRANKSSTSAADDLMPINNAQSPHVRRSAAGGAGLQGRGRAHTLPHDYGLQIKNSPGCERRRRRQRLAQQYRNAAAQKPAADMCQDITDVDLLDSELAISSTFPPSPCHSSFQPRRRLYSLDGGMATKGTDAEISNGTSASTFSVINGGHMIGPTHAHAEDATHQNCPGGGMSQNFRCRIQSSFPRKLALVTAAVMAVCLVVSSVMTTGSQDPSLAMTDQGQVGAGRYDPEVRFLPGMRMEIIARANEGKDIMEDEGGRHRTPEAPSSEEVQRPDPPQRAAQVHGNGRKKRRPRLAHARASFDPIMPSQGTADNDGIGSSGLRNNFQKPSRKLPTFVLPPEETEGRYSMENYGSIKVGNNMSWSKFLVLVAMAVLCIQLLASLRRG